MDNRKVWLFRSTHTWCVSWWEQSKDRRLSLYFAHWSNAVDFAIKRCKEVRQLLEERAVWSSFMMDESPTVAAFIRAVDQDSAHIVRRSE